MHIATAIYVVYGSVSLLLYAIVFIIIHSLRRTNLCGAFSKLILLYSIVNILTYANSWYSHRLRSEPVFWPVYAYLNTNNDLRNALTFLMPLLNYNQSVCNLLLTLNRFSAINFPMRHAKIWNKYIWAIMIISILFGSTAACSRLPIFTIWKYSKTDNSYFIQHLIDKFRIPQNLNAFWYQIGFCSILLIICTAMSIASIANLRKLGGSKSIKETERAFFLVSLFTFSAECANVFMLTGKQLCQSSDYTQLWIAFNVGSPYVTDICSLGLPYSLLLVKGPIQHRLLKTLSFLRLKILQALGLDRTKFTGSETNTIASRSRMAV